MPNLQRTNYTVEELVQMYSEGVIAIPEIQRDFVWDSERIKSLLDSIHKDFPSGAIILWSPPFKDRREFEMLIRPERLHLYKHRLPKYLLLDGQQRLTALCSVLLPPEEVTTSIGEEIDLPTLYVNIKTQEVEVRKHGQWSNNEILLNRILSRETETNGLSVVLEEVRERKDITPRHRQALKDYRNRIQRYTYPVQILQDHDYETVATIFKLVNSQGKLLVTAELELATIVPHWKGFSKHLRSFIKEMRKIEFIADLPFYMKCLAFIMTDWPALDYFSGQVVKGEYSKGELEAAWRRTKRAIRQLHRILLEHYVDRPELITTRNAMVPLVYALAKAGRTHLREAQLIKFLVYAMIGGHYAKRTESVLKRDANLLSEYRPIQVGFEKLLRRLIREELESRKFKDDEFAGGVTRSPYLMGIYLALRQNKARDFSLKKAQPIEDIQKYQVHHIFPLDYMLGDPDAAIYMKRRGLKKGELREEVNDIANMTFISVEANQDIKKRPPFEYLQKFCTPENMKAHCIPSDPELWKPENFAKFCKARRKLLSKAMNSYMTSL